MEFGLLSVRIHEDKPGMELVEDLSGHLVASTVREESRSRP